MHVGSRPSRMRRRFVRLLVGGASLSALVVASVAPAAVHAVAPKVVKKGPYMLADGVELLSLHYSTPNEVRVVTVTPALYDATIDIAAPTPNFGSYKKVSQIGMDNGAIVAINGDFNQGGGPAHFNMIDADLRTTGVYQGTGFAVAKAETTAFAARPDEVVSTVTKRGTTLINSFNVDQWNTGDAANDEIAAYTPVSASAYTPPSGICSALLKEPTVPRWSNLAMAGVSRTYTVDKQASPCPSTAPTFAADTKVILAARKASSTASGRIKALDPGDKITITWKVKDWPGIVDSIGGMPALVDAGVNVGPPITAGTSYFYKNNPRTGVGITEGCVPGHTGVCKVIYMVVDGRQSSTGWSKGMTLKAFAAEFIKQGAYDAINLDGGGATEMWVDPPGPTADFAPCITDVGTGCLVSKPSGPPVGERPSISALLVLAGPDASEPGMGSAAALLSPFTASTISEPSSFLLSAADPGSTGGLMDAMAGGGFGPIPVDPTFQRILNIYGASDSG